MQLYGCPPPPVLSRFPNLSSYLFFIYLSLLFFSFLRLPLRVAQPVFLSFPLSPYPSFLLSWFLLNNGEKLLLIYNWFHSLWCMSCQRSWGPLSPSYVPPPPPSLHSSLPQSDARTHKEAGRIYVQLWKSILACKNCCGVHASLSPGLRISGSLFFSFFFLFILARCHLVSGRKLSEVDIFLCLCEYTYTV